MKGTGHYLCLFEIVFSMLVTILTKKMPKSVKKMNQALGLSKDAKFLYDIVDIASNKVPNI